MIYLLLTIILLLEALFGLAIFRLYQQNFSSADLLEAIAEERAALSKMRDDIASDLDRLSARNREVMDKLNLVAGEIDQDLKNSRSTIESQLAELVQDAAMKLGEPLGELIKKQNSLDIFCRKLQKERDLLQKMIERAQQLYRFFNDKIPYEDLIKDIEYKKYDDARRMFAQGFSNERIMAELGLKMSEVLMMQKMMPPLSP